MKEVCWRLCALHWAVFLGGAGLFKFFGHPVYEIVGIIFMIISVVIIIVGIKKYRTIKKLISDIDPEDWQVLEAMVKKGSNV